MSLQVNNTTVNTEYITNLGLEFQELDNILRVDDKCFELSESLNGKNLNLFNYEQIFGLSKFYKKTVTYLEDNKIHKLQYFNDTGNIETIAYIDFEKQKLRLEFFDNILQKQKFLSPQEINNNVFDRAYKERWTIEDGGFNRFNGNIEIRYRNNEGLVMATVISERSGHIDTVVRYEYIDGIKSKMICTGKFGETTTIYKPDRSQLASYEIDSDGNVTYITKDFSC